MKALVFALFAFAGAPVWQIEGKAVSFAEKYPLSDNCGKTCAAAAALKRAPKLKVEPSSNPSTAWCRAAGGTVLIGRDELSNENSFCRFGDGTFVTCAALVN
ncbi:MAG: hypothetical protein ACXVB9_20355 [Bdellovibrionota bacterium]